MTTASNVDPKAVSAASAPANQASRGRKSLNSLSLQRRPILFGLIAAFVLIGVFGAWAGMAPLSSGAIASGVVGPDSSRKTIQHLEGGIVRELHVRENEQVKAGQPLVTLESVQAKASYSAQRSEWARLLISRARLDAQASGAASFEIPEEVRLLDDPDLLAFAEGQSRLLASRQASLKQQEEIYQAQIAQLSDEISAIEAENQGLNRQLVLLAQELENKSKLVEQQLVSQPELMQLQRQQAQLESSIAANASRMARAGQQKNEVSLQILQAQETVREAVAEESTQVNNDLAQIEERLAAAGDVLERTEIVSPVDGIVLNLRAQTLGGVIRAGEPIMDVVPLNDDMVVVARLAPKDIDTVAIGMEARVNLLPFASRNELPLVGSVTNVAADSTMDEQTGLYYYEIRVRVPIEEVGRHEGVYLAPGMPADVTVVTGERTMLQYLAEPLVRSISRAFVYD